MKGFISLQRNPDATSHALTITLPRNPILSERLRERSGGGNCISPEPLPIFSEQQRNLSQRPRRGCWRMFPRQGALYRYARCIVGDPLSSFGPTPSFRLFSVTANPDQLLFHSPTAPTVELLDMLKESFPAIGPTSKVRTVKYPTGRKLFCQCVYVCVCVWVWVWGGYGCVHDEIYRFFVTCVCARHRDWCRPRSLAAGCSPPVFSRTLTPSA